MLIPIKAISPSKINRKVDKKAEDWGPFVASVKEHGILQPPGVVPLGDNQYRLAFGHRRMEAAKECGLEEIECRVFEDSDALDVDAMTLVENLQRVDLSIAEEIKQITAMEKNGASVKEIAARLGVEPKYVYRRRALQFLTDNWKTYIEAFPNMPVHRLEEIARLDASVQERLFDEFAEYDETVPLGISDADFRVTIMRLLTGFLPGPWAMDDATLLADEKVPSCADCTQRSGANPDLFDEATTPWKEGEICLNLACYAKKRAQAAVNAYNDTLAKFKLAPLLVFRDLSDAQWYGERVSLFKGFNWASEAQVTKAKKSDSESFLCLQVSTGKIMWATAFSDTIKRYPCVRASIESKAKPAKGKAEEETTAPAAESTAATKQQEATPTGKPKKSLAEKMNSKIRGLWILILKDFYEHFLKEFDAPKHLPGWKDRDGLIAYLSVLGIPHKEENSGGGKRIWENIATALEKKPLVLPRYDTPVYENQCVPMRLVEGKMEKGAYHKPDPIGRPEDHLAHYVKVVLANRLYFPSSFGNQNIHAFMRDLVELAKLMDYDLKAQWVRQDAEFKTPASWVQELGTENAVGKAWNKELAAYLKEADVSLP